jgi:hypothetical protein
MSESEQHELYGQSVEILDGDTFVGVGVIDYAIGDRFRVRLPNGRQPWGMIYNLENGPKGLRYVTRPTLDLPTE